PGVFLGSFLLGATNTGSLAIAAGIAIGNTLEPLTGAYLVNRFAGGRFALARAKGLALFVVHAAFLSTTISATIGVTSLALAGLVPWSAFGHIWLIWWLGNAVGAVVVASVVLLWIENPRIDYSRAQWLELSLVAAALVGVGWAVFHASDYPVGVLTLPVCIWAAFRFGQREAATAACVISVIATWATVHGYGPFAAILPQSTALLARQLFIAVTSIVGIAVGGAV